MAFQPGQTLNDGKPDQGQMTGRLRISALETNRRGKLRVVVSNAFGSVHQCGGPSCKTDYLRMGLFKLARTPIAGMITITGYLGQGDAVAIQTTIHGLQSTASVARRSLLQQQ